MKLKIRQIKSLNNYFNIIFEKPEGFTFYPGQYLDIELPVDDPDGKSRAFTISSSPTEEFVMITPRIGITPYKKFMENLKVGNKVQTSHPAGTFTLDENSPAIFLAGGIGITPFRSMIKYAADCKLTTPIALIYSNSDDDFVFKKDLKGWQEKLPNLKIIYINTTKDGYLTFETIKNSVFNIQNSIFYLAGSHSFVNAMEKILLESDVDELNIRYDRFDGY